MNDSTGVSCTTTWAGNSTNIIYPQPQISPWDPWGAALHEQQVDLARMIARETDQHFNTWSPPVTLKKKQFGVIQLGGGTLAASYDTEEEAVSAAGRLAAKDGNEYLVVKPIRLIRQKPVDIEDVAL